MKTKRMMAIATLAVGIGLPTAVYSVFDAVFVHALPFLEPDRVFSLEIRTTDGQFGVSSAVMSEVQALPGIEGAAGFVGSERTFAGNPGPEVIRGAAVTNDFFTVLGTPAVVGTTFGSQGNDDALAPIVLSHRLWKRRFAADPAIVGQTVRFETQDFVIAGVMPEDFRFPIDAEYWERLRSRASGPFGPGPFTAFLRVRSPDPTAARAQLDVLSLAHPGPNGTRQSLQLLSILSETTDSYRPALTMLLIGGVLVLLIACANVSHLLLADSTSRAAELSLKQALGATRGRLVRELFVDAAILALVASAAGALTSWLLVSALPALGTLGIPRLDEARINWRVLAFALVSAAGSVACFGCLPAWVLFRRGVATLPTQKSTAGPMATKLSRAIVAAEVGIALILLVGGVFVATGLYRLLRVDVGFDPGNVLVSAYRPSPSKYRAEARAALVDKVLRSVRALPGIEAAGAISPLPLAPLLARRIKVEGVDAQVRFVSDGALKALGVPLVRGREFAATDVGTDDPGAIVNESFARKLRSDLDVVGRMVQMPGSRGRRLTIIGVARDFRGSLRRLPGPEVYVNDTDQVVRDISLVVRTRPGSARAQDTILAAVRAIDSEQPATTPVTFGSVVHEATEYNRFNAALLGIFGSVAVALAATGILGVVAYSVVRRTREIGIRVALGAVPRQLIVLFLRELAPAIGLGIGIGCVAMSNVSRYLSRAGLLFDVTANDPVVYAASIGFVVVVAVAAALIPARSASRLDPVAALRAE